MAEALAQFAREAAPQTETETAHPRVAVLVP